MWDRWRRRRVDYAASSSRESGEPITVRGVVKIGSNCKCECGCGAKAVAIVAGPATFFVASRASVDTLVELIREARDETWPV